MPGGYAMGTARMSAANSRVLEYSTDVRLGMDHAKALVERWGWRGAAPTAFFVRCDRLGPADSPQRGDAPIKGAATILRYNF